MTNYGLTNDAMVLWFRCYHGSCMTNFSLSNDTMVLWFRCYYGACMTNYSLTNDTMVLWFRCYLGACMTNYGLTNDTMGRQQTNLGRILDVKSSMYFENCEISDLCVTEMPCIADV